MCAPSIQPQSVHEIQVEQSIRFKRTVLCARVASACGANAPSRPLRSCPRPTGRQSLPWPNRIPGHGPRSFPTSKRPLAEARRHIVRSGQHNRHLLSRDPSVRSERTVGVAFNRQPRMRLLSHRHTKFRSAQRPNRKKARFLGESERTYEHRNELGAGHRTVRIKHAVSRSVHDQLVRHPLDVTLRPMSLDILESSVGANRSVHTVIWAIKVAVSPSKWKGRSVAFLRHPPTRRWNDRILPHH